MSQYHYIWDDVKGMFKEDPDHDWTSHFADEFCYAAVCEDQMDNEYEMQFKGLDGVERADPYASTSLQ